MTTNRRTLFRDYMRRLDPTGDPAQAVADDFYVPPPNAVSRRIATGIELQPAGSHLLTGGIGSGKTTELVVIEQKLAEVQDLFPVRVDVLSRRRPGGLKRGDLVALAAWKAREELTRETAGGLQVEEGVTSAGKRILLLAGGAWGDLSDLHDDEVDGIGARAILERPHLPADVDELSEALLRIQGALQRKLVVLFDGLDRVGDLGALTSVLTEDVPMMRRAGVGLVVVGPQNLRFSPQRFVESCFESVHLHGAAGVDTEEGRNFLTAVLRARAGVEILPPEAALALVRWSGGLLRDLIALARASGAEAYASGPDTIGESHIITAADRFGRDLLLGCTKEMAARLRDLAPEELGPAEAFRLVSPPSFTIATELDQRLLTERLIIEVPGTPARYVLHPTIVPLLAGLGAS